MIGQIIKRVYFMQPKLRFRKFVFSLLVLSLTIPTTIQPGLTASKDQVWMSVPVFYATSRQYDKDLGMYSGRRSPEHTDHGLEYGIVTSVIPVPSSTTPNDIAIANLPLKSASRKDAKGHSKLEKLSREEFYKRLSGSTKSTKFNEACLFVHGYNNGFEAAAKSAARLETALCEPVVLFSWPSAAKTRDYTVDECNAEWSARPFQVFAQGLEKQIGPENLMSVSHSMGNRLVNWYLQSRYDASNREPKHLKEIVLTSPDIDRGTFKNYFYKIANNGDRVRLYISEKDLPLRLSQFVHGAPRTGAGLTKEENKWDMPGNITPTQTVNFTEVDDSKIGHSIQYKLIGSMHRTDNPGDGLKLEQDKEYKGEYLRVLRTRNK